MSPNLTNKLGWSLPLHPLVSHCNVPSWQRLDGRTEDHKSDRRSLGSAAVLRVTTRTLPGAAADAHRRPLGDGDGEGGLSRGALLQVDASTRCCRNTAAVLLEQALEAGAHLQEGRRKAPDPRPPTPDSTSPRTGLQNQDEHRRFNVTEITTVDLL